MTESEWLTCADPVAMLASTAGKLSARKVRLFACACCRHFMPLSTGEQYEQAIETAEQFADARTSKAAMKRARQSVRAIRHNLPNSPDVHAWWVALWLVEVTNSENAFDGVAPEMQRLISQGLLTAKQAPPGADLLRCILGNPFRPAQIETSWATPKAVALANAFYDSPTVEGLPMLADALEYAGCSNEDILSHCRQPGPHVRGCWVVDMVLGRR